MDFQRLPFAPEPVETLRLRFPAALAREISIPEMERAVTGAEVPATLTRLHTFDFDSGIRMIASLDNLLPLGKFVHLSFGICESYAHLWKGAIAPCGRFEPFCHELARTFAGQTQPPYYRNLSSRAYHLYFRAP